MYHIAITYSEASYTNYPVWVKGLDADIEIITLREDNFEEIKKCSGVVLSGGIDTHPKYYQRSRTNYPNAPETFNEQRDEFELKVFNWAQENKIPVIAICRGMQLVNVALGGTLIQDLEENNFANHRKMNGVDGMHQIATIPDSFVEAICKITSGTVNSAHHQGIDNIAPELTVGAWSEDHVAEVIERKNNTNQPFFLGVQWHPERLALTQPDNPFTKNIRTYFIDSVKKTTIMQVINPATEEVIANLSEDSFFTLASKLNLLKTGQMEWRKTDLNQRIAVLQKFSDLLQLEIETCASILTSEVGKPLQQSRNEVNGACSRITWLTNNASKYLSDETMTESEGLVEKIVYEPLGVICNISAWNYPYLVGVNVIVPALLAGNACMYKPSEFASLTGLQIEKLLKKAGVPENVFQVAIGAKEVGETLLGMAFQGYYFTGSSKTGKYIYEKVATKMVPCQLELGGKDPVYIADDILDIANVAAGTADGAFYNNGQSCCGVERIYVHEKIYDQFVREFVKEVKTYKLATPTEEGTYIGAITRKVQLDFIDQQVKEAQQKGATVLTGGNQVARKGYFYAPTVLVNVNHDMSIMKDESFGPVIGIMKVSNDEEALALMQDTDFGLTAAVYATSKERADNILAQLQTGTAYWNCCDRVSAALPWSGRKSSGIGATLSHAGLRAFTNPKAYHLKIVKSN